MAQIEWTNPSVKRLAGKTDPTSAIVKRARTINVKQRVTISVCKNA